MRSPTDPADAAATLRAAEATAHRLAGELFPWDLTRALELALLKTFCVPSISGLLARTGEFERRPRKRYDDTGLMVAELLRRGLDSPAGAAVIASMNRIHGHYAIGNDDFLYVLSTFVAEPIRWLARYGWRPLTPLEQEHLFRFWCGVGERMRIAALPPSLEALLALNERVEREAFAPGADGPAGPPDLRRPGLEHRARLAADAGVADPALPQPDRRPGGQRPPPSGPARPRPLLFPAAHPQLRRHVPARAAGPTAAAGGSG
ncbi:oxygenase MpaB family protein [Cyanobium sp. N5-Cardenillas]|uniref:oxygenase MpaB family protein n=1 Tax=Cyanobium sp. N5-Cardenillas TaxID=2823720 RepID=UPI0020CF1CD6|nr:oxygenase MpaB family protein [Cyanobium sp. N5-Cardenillas]